MCISPLTFILSVLFQLFDKDHHINKEASNYIFTTEGHIIRMDRMFRQPKFSEERKHNSVKVRNEKVSTDLPPVVDVRHNVSNVSEGLPRFCDAFVT